MPTTLAPLAPLAPHSTLVFLLQVGLLLLLALILGNLATRFGMPAIVGELAAGVLAGPSVLGHLTPGLSAWLFPQDPSQMHLLDAVGQIGVLLLVGITGIHLDLDLVRRRAGAAAWIGFTALIVPLALGVAAGVLLPAFLIPTAADRVTFALFLGVAMGVSAIPVIAKILLELRLLHRNVGQLTLCAVMIDDIIGWLLLSIVAAMATAGMNAGTVALSIASLGAVVVVALLARPAVGRALRATGRSADSRSTVTLVAALILLSGAATHALRLEAVFGAFACGILVSSCRGLNRQQLAPLQATVMSVLAPLFFATAGLRMDLTALADPGVLAAGIGILVVAVAGKFAGAYVGARISRIGHWESLAIGAGMNARGVIEVIIAMVGLRLGVISPEMFTIIVLVAIATSLMAPPLLRWSMGRVEHTDEEKRREAELALEH
jgi:Kef-type K+ transport system membrane component KefB